MRGIKASLIISLEMFVTLMSRIISESKAAPNIAHIHVL
jgi:hypothetical protein